MKVDFGPPGYRGVTQLVAIGDTELEAGASERVVRQGAYVAAGVAFVGWIAGMPRVRYLGAGAALGLLGVRLLTTGISGRRVEITQPK